jgi:hypothetical protein
MKREMLIGEPIRKFNGKEWNWTQWYAYITSDGSIERDLAIGNTEAEVRDWMEKIAVAYRTENNKVGGGELTP